MTTARPTWHWATGPRRQFPESLVDDYLAGASVQSLAIREHAAAMTVRAFLQARGIEPEDRTGNRHGNGDWSARMRGTTREFPEKLVPERAIAMLVDGMRVRDVAQHYGVSVGELRRVLAEHGVEFRGGA